jgi:hypothetical protein
MANGTKRWEIGWSLFLVALYVGILLHNLNESERRSLDLKESPIAGAHISVSFRVVSVNPLTSDITARLSFLLVGNFAKDPVTPAVDLKLFLNDIRGTQEIVWLRGRRINPVEAVFSLEGNENKYPFDRYSAAIRMIATKQARVAPEPRPLTSPPGTIAGSLAENVGGLIVTAAQEGERAPIGVSINASIPGLKFECNDVRQPDQGIGGFNLVVRRADNVIIVSVMIMVLMMGLAVSVLMMGIQSASGDKIELVPLGLSVSLLFGLPALRNAQPGVPALGAFGDYLSFLWAEVIVAVSAVILIWTWLTRQRRPKEDLKEKIEILEAQQLK